MWSTATISTLCWSGRNYTCLLRSEDMSLKIAVVLFNCLFLYSVWVITFSLINYVNEKSCQKQTATSWQLNGVSPSAVLNDTAENFVMIVFMLLCLSLLRISFGKWLTWAVMMMGGGPAFNNINRPRTARRKMAPFPPSDNNAATLRTHAVNSVDRRGVLVQTVSPVTFHVLLLSHTPHTYAGQPVALFSYCLPALESWPSLQLCMGSVPIYNRGMGAGEGFLLLHCYYFPALPSFIHWPLLYFLFVQ